MIAIPKSLFKNSLLSVGFILITTLSSCGSDDEPVNDNALVGLWKLSYILVDGEDNGEILYDCSNQDTIEFKSNSTYVEVVYASKSFDDETCIRDEFGSSTGTWSIPSIGRLSVTPSLNGKSSELDYEISVNTLSLIFNINDSDYEKVYTRI